MTPATPTLTEYRTASLPQRTGWVHWVAGAGLTFTLFLAMAQIERVENRAPQATIEDLPMVALPLELPPPVEKPRDAAASDAPIAPLTGIEIAPSDSPVRVVVAPPEIERYLPDVHSLPAVVEIGRFRRDYGPKQDVVLDPTHVYQQTEVDKRPHAITRVAPTIPGSVWGDAKSLRVVLVIGIDTDGRAFDAHVLTSSGKPAFDDLVLQTIMSAWRFSPAVKRGKNVKCLVEQPIRISLPDASPFSL